jgi:hypothetical protein
MFDAGFDGFGACSVEHAPMVAPLP